MKRTLFICLSIIMLALVGCKKDENTWGKLQEGSVTLNVGESVQLTFDSNGNKYPQWSSADEFIATVDEKGMVTAQHVGKTTVYVNNLACEVYVVDEYSILNLDEPFKDWEVDNDDVRKYESNKRGIPDEIRQSITFVTDTTMDTSLVWNPETEDFDTIIEQVVDTVFRYVSEAEYDYTYSTEDLIVDLATYQFSCEKEKDGTYTVSLDIYEYRVANAYEDEIYTILDNRYNKISSEQGVTTYQYLDDEGKKCLIVIGKGDDNRIYIDVYKK